MTRKTTVIVCYCRTMSWIPHKKILSLKVNEKTVNVDVSPLLFTNKPGIDKEDNIVWYPEPYYATVSKNGTEINGTFRSVNCTRISENNIWN